MLSNFLKTTIAQNIEARVRDQGKFVIPRISASRNMQTFCMFYPDFIQDKFGIRITHTPFAFVCERINQGEQNG